MLPCPLIVRAHLRLLFAGPPPSVPRIDLALFSTSHPQSPNPFAINPFADPHPLTPIAPISYKNIGGHGITRMLRAPQRGGTSASNLQPGIVQNPVAHPPVFSITCTMPILQPFCFDGLPFSWGGGGVLLLTRNPKKDFYTEGPSGVEGSLSHPIKGVYPERPSGVKALASNSRDSFDHPLAIQIESRHEEIAPSLQHCPASRTRGRIYCHGASPARMCNLRTDFGGSEEDGEGRHLRLYREPQEAWGGEPVPTDDETLVTSLDLEYAETSRR